MSPATAEAPGTKISCIECRVSKPAKPNKAGDGMKLPRGWKKKGEACYCDKCWKKQYVMRAVTLPISRPIDVDWKEFRELLRKAWGQSTSLMNWIMSQMFSYDPQRMPTDAKLQPIKPADGQNLGTKLYQDARQRFPDIDPRAVVSLTHAASGLYNNTRWETVWLANRSLPSFRYPIPYPFRAQDGYRDLQIDKDGRLTIGLKFPGKWVTVQLRTGNNFQRQLAAVRQMIAGEAVPVEFSIYRKRAEASDHRQGDNDRNASGKVTYRIFLKLAAWLPRKPRDAELAGSLEVRTCSDRLLEWQIEGEKAPRPPLHAVHVRQWIKAHEAQLQRLSDDSKAEKRLPRRMLDGINVRRDRIVKNHRNRMNSFLHETSATIANFAERQHVRTVIYNDTVRNFVPNNFPWAELREKLSMKLDERGIAMTHIGPKEAGKQKDYDENETAPEEQATSGPTPEGTI